MENQKLVSPMIESAPEEEIQEGAKRLQDLADQILLDWNEGRQSLAHHPILRVLLGDEV